MQQCHVVSSPAPRPINQLQLLTGADTSVPASPAARSQWAAPDAGAMAAPVANTAGDWDTAHKDVAAAAAEARREGRCPGAAASRPAAAGTGFAPTGEAGSASESAADTGR